MPAVLADEQAAYRYFEQLRWGGVPGECPHCGVADRATLLRPADGVSRATRTGRRTVRRVWRCAACRRQFSVLTGTVFERTRLDLRVWAAVLDELLTGDVIASTLAPRYRISRASADHLLARLRAGIAALPADGG